MAVALFPMIAAVGGAIDLARIHIVTSQMQAGVDAAALAGGSAYANVDPVDPYGRRQQIIAYFKDNFATGYMGVASPEGETPIGDTNTLLEPQFEKINGVNRTTVTAKGALPMSFMSLFGVAPITIQVQARAEVQPHPLEVMVVLDNTGSMQEKIGGVMKIDALKTAMRSFINVLHQGSDTARSDLAMGIINYTNQANVGSLLKGAGVAIEDVPGFTDRNWEAGDGMGWKGCVANDDSVTNMSNSAAVIEPAAYDITNVLPGERPSTNSPRVMRPIRPLIMPPLWLPKSNEANQTSGSAYYTPSSASTNNLYYDTTNAGGLSGFANSSTFKRYFYRYYIALNSNPPQSKHVIVMPDGSSFYDPAAANAFNPLTNTGRDFHVRVENLPNLSSFKPAAPYRATSNNVLMPSPNWQCPEPGLSIGYGRARATYDSFINTNVWGIMPANGTMHHTGFIWGWRILSRTDKFTRIKPVGSSHPVRALVFMTDGKTALGDTAKAGDKIYTGYGSVIDKTITSGTNAGNVINAADLRFAKACALANNHVFADSSKPAQIYVVAINGSNDIDSGSQTRLRNCGRSGYWLTTTPSALDQAFSQIARTLTDVHLTQ